MKLAPSRSNKGLKEVQRNHHKVTQHHIKINSWELKVKKQGVKSRVDEVGLGMCFNLPGTNGSLGGLNDPKMHGPSSPPPLFFYPINLTQIEAKGRRRVANEIPPESHNRRKITDSQQRLSSIFHCDWIHFISVPACGAINPIQTFMKFNNQFLNLCCLFLLQPSAWSHSSIAARLFWPVAREQPERLFHHQSGFHTSQTSF